MYWRRGIAGGTGGEPIDVGPVGLSSYSANHGPVPLDPTSLVGSREGVFSINSGLRLDDIKRGLGNTFAIGESSHNEAGRFTVWEAVRYDASSGLHSVGNVTTSGSFEGTPSSDLFTGFGSQHYGITNFVMCDGSVKPINDMIDHRVFTEQGSRMPF